MVQIKGLKIMKQMKSENKIPLVKLYNKLSFLMCHPDIEVDFEVKNDTKIESLQKMLDNLYDTYSKDENDKKSGLKIKKKSE